MTRLFMKRILDLFMSPQMMANVFVLLLPEAECHETYYLISPSLFYGWQPENNFLPFFCHCIPIEEHCITIFERKAESSIFFSYMLLLATTKTINKCHFSMIQKRHSTPKIGCPRTLFTNLSITS
jgi:hypothetical protein